MKNDLAKILIGKTPLIGPGQAIPREAAWYYLTIFTAFQFYPGYGQTFYWKILNSGTVMKCGDGGFWDIYTEGKVNRHTILNTEYLIWLGKEIADGYTQHSK